MASAAVARDSNTDKAGNGYLITAADPPTVFVDNKPIVCIGDPVQSHGSAKHSNATMIQGSDTVFAYNKAICRKGDKASCDDTIATGSDTVFSA